MILLALDKKETMMYKGIAILLIVLHNFLHLVKPLPAENEFDFKKERFESVLSQIYETPLDSFRVLLSFFGHYGVQVFIFLSAFGLALKLSQAKKDISIFNFFFSRYVKIIPAFFICLVTWSVYINLTLNPIGFKHGIFEYLLSHWDSIAYKVLLLSPFIEGEQLSLNGPWWFISFIFQCYLLFPFLFNLDKRYPVYGSLAISLFGIVFSFFMRDNFYVYFTVLGHLPELMLGIYIARVKKVEFKSYVLLIVTGLFVLGFFYELFWAVSHISALILMLAFFVWGKRYVNNYTSTFFVFLGGISLQLFLVNGFLRRPFLNQIKGSEEWYYQYAYCLVSLIVSISCAYILYRFEAELRALVNTVISRRKQASKTC